MNWLKSGFKQLNGSLLLNTLLLFVIVNVLSLLQLFIYIPRAIFYYEYAIVLFIIIYFNRTTLAYVLFLLFLTLDFFDAFSSVYLFNIVEFFNNIEYLVLYKISYLQILVTLVAIIFLVFIYKLIKAINERLKVYKKQSLNILIVTYAFIFLLDVINGSNKLTDNHKSWHLTNKNIASYIAKNYIYYFIELQQSATYKIDKYTEASPVFKYLKMDSTHSEVVIIVESWGLINDPVIRNNIRALVNEKITENGFSYEWGMTPFNGSTTSAGLKQFLNIKGDYHYFINHRSKNSSDTSIFDIKQTQGYHTSGFHSYTGRMFARSAWWPNIGMQNVYFRDNYIVDHINETNSIQGDAPFPAIKDELMFDYLLNKTTGPQKEFTYFLTVNSHLPFRHKTDTVYPILTNAISKLQVSEEAKNQLMLIHEQIAFFIQKLAKSKYHRIIIMGDHMPPYLNIRDRNFYSPKLVPYLYLSKD
jgi:phosphoglycerol transferase MdoB-like AlkP superfamily enzyme